MLLAGFIHSPPLLIAQWGPRVLCDCRKRPHSCQVAADGVHRASSVAMSGAQLCKAAVLLQHGWSYPRQPEGGKLPLISAPGLLLTRPARGLSRQFPLPPPVPLLLVLGFHSSTSRGSAFGCCPCRTPSRLPSLPWWSQMASGPNCPLLVFPLQPLAASLLLF